MRTVGSPLDVTLDGAGHVVLVPRTHRCASITLRADGARLAVGAEGLVTLRWTDALIGGVKTVGSALWWVGPTSADRGGTSFGVGLHAAGPLADEVREVSRASLPPYRRMLAMGTGLGGARQVVVLPGWSVLHAHPGERATVGALCTALASHPEWRERLEDPARAARLRDSLAGGFLPAPPPRPDIRPSSVDLLIAMHRLGLVWPCGRPFPGDTVPDEEGTLDRLRARLDRRPGRPPRVRTEQIVRAVHDYVEIEPWPFSGLTD
jgi:hypothetical protein